MTFSMMGCGFMSQPIVRIIRAVLGLVLIALALFVMGGTVGTVVGIIGIVVGLVGLVLIAAGTPGSPTHLKVVERSLHKEV